MPALLLLGWALLLLLASQLPQADAPLPVADGLNRNDRLTLQALGLHRLGASVPALLLAAASVIVGAARWLFPADVALARHPGDMAELERGLRAMGLRPRSVRHDDRVRVLVGMPGVGPAVLAVATALALAAWALHGSAPAGVWTDVQIGPASQTLTAWSVDGGILALAPGHWEGGCEQAGTALHCRVEAPGAHGHVELAPGSAATIGPWQVTWQGRASAIAGVPEVVLRWVVHGKPWLLKLATGEVGESPELGARLQPFATRTAGPLVVGSKLGDHTMFALVPSLIAPPGARAVAATVQAPEVARLAWSPVTFAPMLLAAALILAVVGAVLAWLLPVLRVDAEPDGTLIVRHCNRSTLLRLCATLRTSAGG